MSSKHPKVTTDALSLLKQDHSRVTSLLAQLVGTTEHAAPERERLLAEFVRELQVHSQLEEEIFYPALRDAARTSKDAKLHHEALEKHQLAEVVTPDILELLPDILECDPATSEFTFKCKVLKDLVEQHAAEEERGIFARARRLLDANQLRDLGARISARKEELWSAVLALTELKTIAELASQPAQHGLRFQ